MIKSRVYYIISMKNVTMNV